VHVRRATADDLPALTNALARAFMDDPVARWSCQPERLRMSVLERFHGTRLRQLLAHDDVWTTGDRAGAALWAPPRRWRSTAREDLALTRSVARLRLAPRLPFTVAGMLGIERRHPLTPDHWYLAVLGIDPRAQGQGLGSAVLRPSRLPRDRRAVAAAGAGDVADVERSGVARGARSSCVERALARRGSRSAGAGTSLA
jgi:ribosomal protein S18 acetylase RimI-like enzyme